MISQDFVDQTSSISSYMQCLCTYLQHPSILAPSTCSILSIVPQDCCCCVKISSFLRNNSTIMIRLWWWWGNRKNILWNWKEKLKKLYGSSLWCNLVVVGPVLWIFMRDTRHTLHCEKRDWEQLLWAVIMSRNFKIFQTHLHNADSPFGWEQFWLLCGRIGPML